MVTLTLYCEDIRFQLKAPKMGVPADFAANLSVSLTTSIQIFELNPDIAVLSQLQMDKLMLVVIVVGQ